MLAIIPARGGSKGVPRKNIRKLCGRPLISYAIDAALKADRIDRVVVSTEDEEIAEISRQCGAEVPFMRPAELATDTAPNGAACLHMVDELNRIEKGTRDCFALIQTTSPFLTAEAVDGAVALFEERRAAAVVSLSPFETPIEAVFELDGKGRLKSVLRERYGAEFEASQRQSYGPRYVVCGAVTVLRTQPMRADPNYYFTDPDAVGYPVDELTGFDIDTMVEFSLAEALMSQQGGTPGSSAEARSI